MDITITRIGTEYLNGDPNSSDITNTYLVIQYRGQAPGIVCSEHGEREGEAGYPLAGGALPVEGATRAPVIDNAKEFRITCRTHSHGGNLGIEGQEGILYTDEDDNTVRRQVIAVGKTCGISIESDEVVEGLTPQALRGVVIADRSIETTEIRSITVGSEETPSSSETHDRC
jgi:hypothetical protein